MSAPVPAGDPPSRPLTRVRDAMVSEPRTLPAEASAQEAGAILSRVEVRSVPIVGEGGRLLGEVTRALLVERVVAAGLDPRAVAVGTIVEPVAVTLDAELDVDEAIRVFEETGVERLPVLDGGRLVGVLSRSVVRRRLAEDEPPPEPEA